MSGQRWNSYVYKYLEIVEYLEHSQKLSRTFNFERISTGPYLRAYV